MEVVKGKRLTKDESKFLLDLIEGSKIITTKTTNATNNKLKNEEWIRLAERFNASTTNRPRTVQQLRLKWENLKKNARKRSTRIRMNQIKTGGGPAHYFPPDDILDRVNGLLGTTVRGFTVPFGGDKEVDVDAVDADYFTTKKEILDIKLNNLILENNNLKLKNLVLRLNTEKLILEKEKLKLEVKAATVN